MSVTTTRKLCQSIGQLVPAAALACLAFTKCNQTLAVFWLCLAVGVNGCSTSGFQV